MFQSAFSSELRWIIDKIGNKIEAYNAL